MCVLQIRLLEEEEGYPRDTSSQDHSLCLVSIFEEPVQWGRLRPQATSNRPCSGQNHRGSACHLSFTCSQSLGAEGRKRLDRKLVPGVGTAGLDTGQVLASFPQSSKQRPVGHPLMAQRHPARMAAVPAHKVTFWWELL